MPASVSFCFLIVLLASILDIARGTAAWLCRSFLFIFILKHLNFSQSWCVSACVRACVRVRVRAFMRAYRFLSMHLQWYSDCHFHCSGMLW